MRGRGLSAFFLVRRSVRTKERVSGPDDKTAKRVLAVSHQKGCKVVDEGACRLRSHPGRADDDDNDQICGDSDNGSANRTSQMPVLVRGIPRLVVAKNSPQTDRHTT